MRCLIAGAAKTGTTALLYAVAEAMGQEGGAAPAVYMEERIATFGALPAHAAAKVIFEQEGGAALADFGAAFDRRILLIRDPRDTLVSRLLYLVANRPALLGDLPYLRSFGAELRAKQRDPAALALLDLAPLRAPSAVLDIALAATRDLAAFAQRHRDDWFVLRYDDLVGGQLDALSAYLGMPVRAGTPVDPTYARVARTKATGDWRHWFTASDVAQLRPLFEPVMRDLGYADDWRPAPVPVIAAAHSWEYFARLVHERRGHFGLAPADVDLFPHADDAPTHITKGDIVNRLVRQFGLDSYLEYNKFDGASYYDDVVCADKTLAYLPEHSYLDAATTRRLLAIAATADLDAILPLPDLLARFAGRTFDIVFFDPVHVRPAVDDALRALPALLKPGGVLVVHDCNPLREAMTSPVRTSGHGWMGETYQAFALLRHHNRAQVVTVAEDFGVGLVWNRGLRLDYDIDADIDYAAFARQRVEYAGLMSYQQFLEKTAGGDIAQLFAQAPPAAPAPFHARAAKRFVDAAGARIECQLFWRTRGGDFSEADSLTVPLGADGRLQDCDFVLPATAAHVDGLRFDFADAASAAVHVAAMTLRDPQGALMWTWDAHAQATQDWRATQACLAHDPPRLYLLATDADPQYHPALPSSILARLGAGWTFHVAIAPQPEPVRDLLAELLQTRAQAAAVPL